MCNHEYRVPAVMLGLILSLKFCVVVMLLSLPTTKAKTPTYPHIILTPYDPALLPDL